MKLSIIAIIFALNICFVAADYINANSTQYDINFDSCPAGEMCDFIAEHANITLTQVNTLRQLTAYTVNLTVNNDTFAKIKESMFILNNSLTLLTNMYQLRNAAGYAQSFMPVVYIALTILCSFFHFN
jgi:hypothetical protein